MLKPVLASEYKANFQGVLRVSAAIPRGDPRATQGQPMGLAGDL